MTILYFGIYDPLYSRNRVLIKGLKKNGVGVIECREDPRVRFKFIRLFLRYFKMCPEYDLMVVGFPGQEIMFLARFLTFKPIIFDAFTSHYGGYVLDRQYFSKNSFRAKYYRFLDKWSCRLANIVLLDTKVHIDFFVKEYGLLVDKFRRIFVGTDESVFYPRELLTDNNSFLVHFHGNAIPLQGISYIIEAAKILEKDNISFNIIGTGQTHSDDVRLAGKLGVRNVKFIDRVTYQELADYMSKADICLGIFGGGIKTGLVIPNKVFESLAMKKPVVTGDTSAIRELLGDKDAILVKTADARSLAEEILRLKSDKVLANEIAENGYNKFIKFAESGVLGHQLVKIIEELI